MTSDRVVLKKGYKPRKNEKYMNAQQQEYFRQKLLAWREELVEESRETISHLQHEVRDVGDEAERATRETENALELRTRDRYRKLIRKIEREGADVIICMSHGGVKEPDNGSITEGDDVILARAVPGGAEERDLAPAEVVALDELLEPPTA